MKTPPRMLEDPSVVLRDMTLENPIRAIREISHDPTCKRKVRLANGRCRQHLTTVDTSVLELRFEPPREIRRRRHHSPGRVHGGIGLELWDSLSRLIGRGDVPPGRLGHVGGGVRHP